MNSRSCSPYLFAKMTALSTILLSSFAHTEVVTCSDSANCPESGQTGSPIWAVNGKWDLSLAPSKDENSNHTASSTNNTVILNYDPALQPAIKRVFGAHTLNENADSNTVKIKKGKVDFITHGGKSLNGNASENTVVIEEGAVLAYVYGGLTKGETGSANENNVIVNGGKTKEIIGGATDGTDITTSANRNKILISSGMIKGNIFGGKAKNGDANDNVTEINNSVDFTGPKIISGHAKKDALGNTITINGGKVSGAYNSTADIRGGYSSAHGLVKYNIVTIKGGDTIDAKVYGGYATHNIASYNKVLIDNTFTGTVNDIVMGGFARSYSGAAIRQANENSVVIKGGNFQGKVVGGYAKKESKNNSVLIDGGTIDKYLYGGESSTSDVVGNTVTVKSGTVNDELAGGYSNSRYGNAESNLVNILGGKIGGDVYGGKAGKGKAVSNIVTIKGTPVFDMNKKLYGGNGYPSSTNDVFTGNTLNFHSKDITVSDVINFENYQFYLGNDVVNGDTLVKLTTTDTTDLSNSFYGVGVEGESSALATGDKIILIESAGTLTLSSVNPSNIISNMTDLINDYDFELSIEDGNKLVATLTSSPLPEPDPSYKLSGVIDGLVSDESVTLKYDAEEKSFSGSTFEFDTKIMLNGSYEVSVLESPKGKICTVTENASATNVTADITDVKVTCLALPNGSVQITGETFIGDTLTATVSDEDGIDNSVIIYQWFADDSEIVGATEQTYPLTSAEEGKKISVRVTYTDDIGVAEMSESDKTETVRARPVNGVIYQDSFE